MTEYEPPPARPWCALPPGGVVVLYPGVSKVYENCDFPPGTTFRAYYDGDPPMDTDTPIPAPAEPKPLIEQPAAPAFDPSQLQQLGAENPMLAIALAAVAVLGGGAAWKHWGKMSEQKHEQAMKQLELQASAQANVPTVQPPPCQAADAATQARISALEGRLAKAEQASSSVSLGLSDEMEERIAKLEKAVKAKKAATKTASR